MKDIRIMRYSGNKFKFIPIFQKLEAELTCKTFIEPFLGSGSIFANTKIYDKYIINDLNKEMICIFKAFNKYEYTDLLKAKEFIDKKFGDIKTNKSSYYEFRNWYNEKYHFTDKSIKGLFLYFIINSTINSFARWGPNGFNNSFGNRFYMMDETSYNLIKIKLKKSDIYSINANDIIEKYDNENSLIFCDPPYMDAKTSYTNNFDEAQLCEFLNLIKTSKSKIIYTDIQNKFNMDILSDWEMFFIKDMINTSPNRKIQKTGKIEVFFKNF